MKYELQTYSPSASLNAPHSHSCTWRVAVTWRHVDALFVQEARSPADADGTGDQSKQAPWSSKECDSTLPSDKRWAWRLVFYIVLLLANRLQFKRSSHFNTSTSDINRALSLKFTILMESLTNVDRHINSMLYLILDWKRKFITHIYYFSTRQ